MKTRNVHLIQSIHILDSSSHSSMGTNIEDSFYFQHSKILTWMLVDSTLMQIHRKVLEDSGVVNEFLGLETGPDISSQALIMISRPLH